jgi:hypothetical protein
MFSCFSPPTYWWRRRTFYLRDFSLLDLLSLAGFAPHTPLLPSQIRMKESQRSSESLTLQYSRRLHRSARLQASRPEDHNPSTQITGILTTIRTSDLIYKTFADHSVPHHASFCFHSCYQHAVNLCYIPFYVNVKSVLYHANLTHYTRIINTGRYSLCKVTNILPVRGKLTKCYCNDDVKEYGNVARMGNGFVQSSDRKALTKIGVWYWNRSQKN